VDGVHVDVSETHIWDQDASSRCTRSGAGCSDCYPGDRMMVGEVFLFDVPRIARYVGARGCTGVQLHRHAQRLDRQELRPGSTDARPGLRPRHLVCLSTMRPQAARDALLAAGDLGRRRRGLGPSARCCSRCPGSPVTLPGRGARADETGRARTTLARGPGVPALRAGAVPGAAGTAAARRCRGRRRARATASPPARRGCPFGPRRRLPRPSTRSRTSRRRAVDLPPAARPSPRDAPRPARAPRLAADRGRGAACGGGRWSPC
jgi:hypothetical protein